MFLILCILAGVNIFEYINQPRPSWWAWCTENKIYACMMLFFLSNIIEVQLVQSGAFEILLNDVPVWSKLETGRIPQPAELFQIIDNHMRFDSKLEYNNGFAKWELTWLKIGLLEKCWYLYHNKRLNCNLMSFLSPRA